jgi:hypothetical protein
MEAPMSKKTKEPPKRANHKGNIKFPKPLMSREAYQMEPPKRANHKGNIKFPNPLMSQEAYQMEPPNRANHKGNIKFPNPPHVTRSISNERGRTS